MVEAKFVNAKEFDAAIEKWAKKTVPWKFDQGMVKIVTDIVTETIALTPVSDTPDNSGRLRGGWDLDIDRFDTEENGRRDENGGTTEANALSKLTAARRASGSLIGKTIYFFNNVFYAVYVEFGTPKMAPFAMLRTALSKVTASLS